MNFLEKIPLINKLIKKEKIPQHIFLGIDSDRRRASLFYYPIRTFFRAIAKTQHQEIQAIGIENIPPDGAVFLVGNHPNSYLDFFNLITIIPHPVATAAKDVITNTPIIGPILKNHALMIPVARAQDKAETGMNEEERAKTNEEMIKNAVDTLVKGRLFNIYAEGRSTDSRKLNKIKLGFMALAIEAEKKFNFNLNLRIVPYGYYYDRINKFQSSVCIIFGKPFKIKNIVEMPDNFNSLSEKEKRNMEKRILVQGKQKLKAEIERNIISIEDSKLIPLIDEATLLYLKSPHKYMHHYGNIKGKYVLSKLISESIQNANMDNRGKKLIQQLKRVLSEYRRKVSVSKLTDNHIKKEYTLPIVTFQIVSAIKGILFLPLIIYGFSTNYIPRLVGRFMRYWIIVVKKKEKVDGDEQAIIAALVSLIVTYPLWASLIYYISIDYLLIFFTNMVKSFGVSDPEFHIQNFSTVFSVFYILFIIYLMARLWRFSLKHGRRLKNAILFLKDAVLEPFSKKRLKHLRELRHKVIDTIDFIIGDYS